MKFEDILGKHIDMDKIRAEHDAILGPDLVSRDLVLALAIKALADKFELQINELKDQLFINSPSLQELEDQGKLPGVPSLDGHRNMKEASENLGEIVNTMNEMSQEQLQAFARKEAEEAAKLDPTITLGTGEGLEGMDSKDIYLCRAIKAPDESTSIAIIGLHAIGHAGPYSYDLHKLDGTIEKKTSNFMALETWGNEYDDNHNMLGRGSFRLHNSNIDEVAAEFEAEGWTRYEGPKRRS